MNILRSIKRSSRQVVRFLSRKSRVFRRVYSFGFGAPSWSKRDYQTFAQEGYAGNPYVYAAINALVDAASTPPPILYRVKEGGQVARAMQQAYDMKASVSGFRKKAWTKEQAARQVIRAKASMYVKRAGIHPAVARRIAVKQLAFAGELEEIISHPVLDLLMRPNGYYQNDFKTFVKACALSLQIAGEMFTEPQGNAAGKGIPTELYVHPAHRFTSMRPLEGNPLPGFHYNGGGRDEFAFDPDPVETEIFFNKFYDPVNPLRGLSPMEAAIRSIDLNNEGRKYNLRYMQNGGVPAGMVTGQFDETQAAAIEADYERDTAGSDNAGRLLTIGGKNLKYHQLGLEATKMLWADTVKMTAREAAIVYNVAPEIIGDSANKTYNNYESARLALYQDAGLPLADFIYSAWNATWVKRFGDDLMLDYDTDQIIPIQEDLNKAYERLDKASFLTLNEKRESVGWEPIDGGDVILVPINLVPLEASLVADDGERSEALETAAKIRLLNSHDPEKKEEAA